VLVVEVSNVELDEPEAVVEREMVFVLSVEETGGLVPSMRGGVVLGGVLEVITDMSAVV
jgi:hypothetical protein